VPPASRELHAGALRTTLLDGRLRSLVIDDHESTHEVWHGVHFLLRDTHWRTPTLLLDEPRHAVLAHGWRVTITGCFDTTPRVPLRIDIEGHDDGTLVYTGEARIDAHIDINRLGLCLLHPLCAAVVVRDITHDDGRTSRSTLPTLVPPWPPFTAIRALRHEFAPGAWASAEFDGDSFELEDQRNNADASFKTYSRSNAMPRPYRLRAGDVVRQSVRLCVIGAPACVASLADASRQPRGEARAHGEARLGLEITRDDLAGPRATAALAARLRPEHLHLSLSASNVDFDAHALATVLDAASAALRLDVLDLSADNAAAVLEQLSTRLVDAGLVAADLAVFPTTPEHVAAARRAFPHTRIGGGTPHFFVQLNRQERLPKVDFLSFTICPIVHSADDATVIESHRSIPAMFDTLRARWPDVPVQVGPSRIAARGSPLGDLGDSDGTRSVPLAGVDSRDHSDFGATWTAGHIAALRKAGAQAITVSSLGFCAKAAPVAGLWDRDPPARS
jgi:D-apionolactonase